MKVEVSMRIDIWWDDALHCWYRLGQQHTAVWNAPQVSIRSFGFDIVAFWGGWIHLMRGRGVILQWFGRCRSVQIKRLRSYDIGEEICKWQCVHCAVIYWEWCYWLTFFRDFYTCCIENNQKKSHSTIAIAIRCILASLDSIQRSFGVWHDNIQCLALRIRSSLVLHILGENCKTKNDDFSRSREP